MVHMDIDRLCEVLDGGDEEVLPILADALEEAGNPLASPIRRIIDLGLRLSARRRGGGTHLSQVYLNLARSLPAGDYISRAELSDGRVRVVGMPGAVSEKEFALSLGESPTGEWSGWFPFGATRRRTRDGVRVFLCLEDVEVTASRSGFPTGKFRMGETIVVPLPGFYTELADADSDYCMYCGADNGPHGEYRQGWDCHTCGGN